MRKWLLSSAIALQCFNLNAASNCCDDFCNNLHVEASWLYWQVDSSNYNFLNTRTVLSTNDTNTSVVTEQETTQKMPWDSGFRLGFGFNLPCWGLDVKATWSDFHSSGTKKQTFGQPSAADTTLSIVWPFIGDVVFLSDSTATNQVLDYAARQKISFDFDPVNLEFGKWVSFDCVNIALRPHVGLQYLQYQDHRQFQRISNVANRPQASNEYSFKQRFQGFGLRGGFDLAMPLFCDITLVGNVAASIDWGRNKTSFKGNLISSTSSIGAPITRDLEVKRNEHNSQALIDLGIGLQWETCICDGYGLTIAALWEQHQLINGSKLWANAPINANAIPNSDKKGDLTVRGLSLTAGLTF